MYVCMCVYVYIYIYETVETTLLGNSTSNGNIWIATTKANKNNKNNNKDHLVSGLYFLVDLMKAVKYSRKFVNLN